MPRRGHGRLGQHETPAHAGQRRASAPGEDRNPLDCPALPAMAFRSAGRPRPARIATGRVSPPRAGRSTQRRASAPGEDRNDVSGTFVMRPEAAPGVRARRGSQPREGYRRRRGDRGSAGRPRPARIATSPPPCRSRKPSKQRRASAPPARIATTCPPPARAAARRQRRASAPGEDRNDAESPWITAGGHAAAPGVRARRGSQHIEVTS